MNLNLDLDAKLENSRAAESLKCDGEEVLKNDDSIENQIVNVNHVFANANSNGVCVDLRSKSLPEIPTSFYDLFSKVKYLYLEGNCLRELSDSFFPSLSHLKWLDVRNNKLHAIPNSIGGHQTLETLLLQGNKIKELPLELGQVPKLRGLQLHGNPVVYPSQEVIANGIKYLLQFLRDEFESKSCSNVQPVSDLYYKNTKSTTEINKKITSRKLGSKSCTNTTMQQSKTLQLPSEILELKDAQMTCIGKKTPLFCNARARPNSLQISLNHTSAKDCFVPNDDVQLPVGGDLSVEEKFFSHQKRKEFPSYENEQNDRDAKIQENFLNEMWICKLKDMIEQQGKILQRRKDEDILNDWRQEYKKRQSIPRSSKFKMTMPYDTNPHLIFDGTEIPQPKRATERLRDIGIEMAEIFQTLQCMSGSKIDEQLSPQTKQTALDLELKKLAQLQQKLAIIKNRNNSEYRMLQAPERITHSQGRKSAPNLHAHSLMTGPSHSASTTNVRPSSNSRLKLRRS